MILGSLSVSSSGALARIQLFGWSTRKGMKASTIECYNGAGSKGRKGEPKRTGATQAAPSSAVMTKSSCNLCPTASWLLELVSSLKDYTTVLAASERTFQEALYGTH